MISGSELQQASIEDRKRLLTKPNEYSRNLIRTLERASRKESLGDGQHSSTYMAKIEDFVWEQEVLARVSDFGIKDVRQRCMSLVDCLVYFVTYSIFFQVPMGARQIALKLLATLLQFIGPNVLQLQHARQQLGTLMRRTFEHYRSRTTYHKLLSCQEKNTGDGNFCVWLEDTLASQANRQTNRSFYWLTRTASVLLIHLIDSTTKLAPFFLSEGSSPKEGSVEESRTVSLELIFEILKHGWLEQTKDSLDVGALAREALVMALESQVEPVIVCLARDEKWYRDINMVMSWLWKCVRYNSVKHAAHSVKLLEMLIHFYDCITLDDSSQTNATLCDVQMKLKAQFTHFVDEHVVSNFGKAEQRNECILLLKVLDCLESSQGSRKLTLPFLRTCICRAVGGMRDTTAIETILALCKSENYFDTMTGMELIASLLRAGDLRSCELLLGGLPNHKTRPQVKDKLQSLEATLENKLKEWWQVSELTIDTSFIAAEAEKHLLGSLLADVDEENTEACTKTDEECRISQLVISKLLKLFKMQSGEHTIVSSIIAAMFSVPRFYGVDSLLSAEVSVPNKRDKSFTFEGVMQEVSLLKKIATNVFLMVIFGSTCSCGMTALNERNGLRSGICKLHFMTLETSRVCPRSKK